MLTYIFVQAERPAGEDRRVALSIVWLNKIQYTNALLLSTLWRSEIAMGHGAVQRSLGIRDDDDGDDDYDDEGLC